MAPVKEFEYLLGRNELLLKEGWKHEYRQDQIVDILRREGFSSLNVRTLRYWRQIGKLPPLSSNHLYPGSILGVVRTLCLASKRLKPQVILTHTVEDVSFQITRIEVLRANDVIYLLLYEKDGGFLVRQLEERDLDAFT